MNTNFLKKRVYLFYNGKKIGEVKRKDIEIHGHVSKENSFEYEKYDLFLTKKFIKKIKAFKVKD